MRAGLCVKIKDARNEKWASCVDTENPGKSEYDFDEKHGKVTT